MAKGLVQTVAYKTSAYLGREVALDPLIPHRDLLGEAFRRALELIVGIIRVKQVCFVGRNVTVMGSDRLKAERGAAIGGLSIIDARGTVGVRLGYGAKLGRRGVVMTTSHLSRLGVGLTLGDHSSIADNFHIGASGGVVIGNDVIVGPFLTIHSQEHIFDDPNVKIRKQGVRVAAVRVGNDCWIGSRVTLLAGAHIGDRTVIASGAVVRGTFPDGVLLGGIPAKIIREI